MLREVLRIQVGESVRTASVALQIAACGSWRSHAILTVLIMLTVSTLVRRVCVDSRSTLGLCTALRHRGMRCLAYPCNTDCFDHANCFSSCSPCVRVLPLHGAAAIVLACCMSWSTFAFVGTRLRY